MIAQIEHSFPADPDSPRAPAERVPNLWCQKHREVDWVAPQAVAIGVTVDAFVNDSRWVARCPCGGAELVSRDDPRFWCCSCHNAAWGGLWATVVFPKQANKIEQVLSERPNPQHRHWQPGETVVDLTRETKIRGLS